MHRWSSSPAVPGHRRVAATLLTASFAVFLGSALGERTCAEQPGALDIEALQSVSLPDDPAAVIAVVGQSPILMGEIKPKIDTRIEKVLEKAGDYVPEDQVRLARIQMTRALLAQAIQRRMMRESYLIDQVGTQDADKRREADETLQAKARQMFFETEMAELMEQYDVQTASELDEKLREKGTSLPIRQREFVDAMLGHLFIRGKVNKDPAVSLAEILRYYQTHQEEFHHKARARWEQLTVRFDRFATRKEAYDAIWAMGREAFFGGNMQAVAKEKSQEPFASSGGLHDWTNQGSLASRVLDEQIFSLPTDAMSQIIEDEVGYHIVRVLEREPAGMTPLSEVQDDIRAIIRDRKIAEAQAEAMKSVRQSVPVWSLFHNDVPGARPLPDAMIAAAESSTADASSPNPPRSR